MRVQWGRLTNAAMAEGYRGEEAVIVVLRAAWQIEAMPLGPPALSVREAETLQTLSACRTAKAAAAMLGVREDTVRRNTHNARQKLGVHTTAEAIQTATSMGLIEAAA